MELQMEYQSLVQTIEIYNRRKLVDTQRLVLDAENDRVFIIEKAFDPDTGLMSEKIAATINRATILLARTQVANARTLINNFVTEVQEL